jgi:ankyrin repeat protein
LLRKYFREAIYLLVAAVVSSANAQSVDEFFRAVNRGDGQSVAGLLARGVDPNVRDPRGQTALHLALRDDSPKVTEALLAHPAVDVNALNDAGESPLMMAALRGQLGWAERLLARGAKVHQAGWAPIHYAATGPEPKLVALLLDRGAPLEAESPNRSTPLMMAAGYGPEASVDLLLARGADARRRNDRDYDAAAFARQGGREFLVKRLQGAASAPR